MNNRRWVALGVAMVGMAAIYGVAHMPLFRAPDGHYYTTFDGCLTGRSAPKIVLGVLFKRANWSYVLYSGDPSRSRCVPVPLYQALRGQEQCVPVGWISGTGAALAELVHKQTAYEECRNRGGLDMAYPARSRPWHAAQPECCIGPPVRTPYFETESECEQWLGQPGSNVGGHWGCVRRDPSSSDQAAR